MKMRPCDLIKLHTNDIDTERNTLCYWATKKKNYTKQESAIVRAALSKVAKKIIKKYAGKSSMGYVFPFAMNEYDWQLKDNVSFNKWYNRNKYRHICVPDHYRLECYLYVFFVYSKRRTDLSGRKALSR